MSVKILEKPLEIESIINEVTRDRDEEHKEDPFVVFDLGDVYQKYGRWKSVLPRVQPHYAMKANDDPHVLQIMANIGASFDCASKGEIEKILNLGVSPSRILYANPIKQKSFLKYAADKGVHLMTFDTIAELHNIKDNFPAAKLLLRILPPEFKATSPLGKKFGCPLDDVTEILQCGKALNLNIMGISFHIGGGCMEAEAFSAAIGEARKAFDIGIDLGFHMEMLDIGGGYPGHDDGLASFDQIVVEVNKALETYFPEEGPSVQVISEPGRFFVSSSVTLVVNIIGKREVNQTRKEDVESKKSSSHQPEEERYMYYINESIYGVFNTLLHDSHKLKPQLIKQNKIRDECEYPSSLWGPTCDGVDLVLERCNLPELDIGDWIYFQNLGAYALSGCSQFNGFPLIKRIYTCTKEMWPKLELS